KETALVAEPEVVLTMIGPVNAPAGTGKVRMVPAAALLKLPAVALPIITDVTSKKVVPVTETLVPTPPPCGMNEAIAGGTTKSIEDGVPPGGVVTKTGPVRAPAGTMAVRLVFETLVNMALTPPEKNTPLAPRKLTPWT